MASSKLENPKKISFLCNDATHIQLEDESVEIIIGCRFFGTLSPESRQDEVFKEMQRVLKK
ncbi:MAG: class I SAM-dependent methyltransferase [Candidatus Peribacteria bacterium]|nr:class I SAM-dependent methyltransferase [Candidatus Peribacteria bacterium]